MMIDADRYRFEGLTPPPLPDLGGVEICSCDEALALRGEIERLRAALGRRAPPLDARAATVLAAWGGGSDGLD